MIPKLNRISLVPKSQVATCKLDIFLDKNQLCLTNSQVLRICLLWWTGSIIPKKSILSSDVQAIEKSEHHIYIEYHFFYFLRKTEWRDSNSGKGLQ